MSPKTPVSILHEYCILRHRSPEYNLKSAEPTSKTETTFTYTLTLFNENATGSGSTKKAAKHETARALLNLLADKDPELKQFLKENGLGEHNKIETPYVHHNVENYVGKLEVLTLLNNVPTPKYDQLYEEGMSHDKIFTCTCQIGNLRVEASHRTKQQAKHTSASLMIAALEKSLGDLFVTTIPEDFRIDYNSEDYTVERKKVRSHLLTRKKCPLDVRFNAVPLAKLHRVFNEPHLDLIPIIQRILDEMGKTTEEFIEFLDDENSASRDIVLNIVDKVHEGTGIDVDFVTLDFSPAVNKSSSRLEECTDGEREVETCAHSDNTCADFHSDNSTQNFHTEHETTDATKQNCHTENETTDATNQNIHTENETSDDTKQIKCDNENETNDDTIKSDTEVEPELSITTPAVPMKFVTCKMFIAPTLSFLGIAPTVDLAERKAAVLLLKYIMALNMKPSKKNNFFENFSSGDEA
uniref:Interferon-inducible double-stranded RNA-dependent protein kinase activator A homolog n=2 Tax=Cacopsylla melanoneura TaxID=428564 RepID=A0A8D9BN41_9HEMI